MFGLQWQAMIQGLAFMSHQLGSFVGAYGGGLIYDALGSYTMAWRIGVALGLAAGIIQVTFALLRPTEPPLVAARQSISHTATKSKRGRKAPFKSASDVPKPYLILDSRNSTCLRATGSYFFFTSLSVMVREFFLAT